MIGAPTTLEDLLDLVAALYSAESVPFGVDPDSAMALVGKLPIMPAERVLITLAPDPIFEANPPADRFLVLRPDDGSTIEGQASGGGNKTLGTATTFTLSLWNRFEADMPLSDVKALKDETNGILRTWRKCMTITSQYLPQSGGNAVTIEPIRFLTWGLQQRTTVSPWTILRSRWSMRFIQKLG